MASKFCLQTLGFTFVLIGTFALDNLLLENRYNLQGKPDGGYYTKVLIGTPPQELNVLIDTGSSNFAVAGYNDSLLSRHFVTEQSSTFVSKGPCFVDVAIDVHYTEGQWHGSLGEDHVVLPQVFNQSVKADIAIIQTSTDFYVNGSDWQGIMGLAYKSISRPNGQVQPFFDSLVEAGLANNSFSLLLCNSADVTGDDNVAVGGILTFGREDNSQYKEKLYPAAIIDQSFYEIIIADIKVNNQSLDMDCQEYNTDKSIIDSGTTNLRLPTAVYSTFMDKLKQSVSSEVSKSLDDQFWSSEAPGCVIHNDSSYMYSQFPTIAFDIMGSDYVSIYSLVISPQQYLRPYETSRKNKDCYKLAVSSSSTGSVLGAVIMEGFYVFFDRHNLAVSFAQTTCKPRTNDQLSFVMEPHSHIVTQPWKCRFIKKQKTQFPVYAIALIVTFSVLAIALIVAIVLKILKEKRKQYRPALNDIDINSLVDDTDS